MTLIKTSILSAITTFIRVIAGFIITKIVAVYIGPSGMAIVGQLNNFIGIINSVASAGIQSGVVKYTAEYCNDIQIKQKIWSTAFRISFILVLPMVIAIIIFSDYISIKLLQTSEYSSILIIFALSLVFFVFNGLLISILNGQGEIKKLTVINILGNIIGLIATVLLVIKYQLYGALLAGVISQPIIFLVSILIVLRSNWFKLYMFLSSMDREYIIKLLKYSAMAIVSGTLNPLSHIYIRNYIVEKLGWDQAGYWQAIWKISEVYLMIITTTLSIYYLPKLSSLKDKKALKEELIYGYKIIMPVVSMMALGIYIFRNMIIKILFTKDFAPMEELFLFQLLGDVVKIASWLLGYIMVAKAMTRLFIISEILFTLSFVGFVVIFINLFGLIGVTLGYLVNYCFYLVFLYYFLWRYLDENPIIR